MRKKSRGVPGLYYFNFISQHFVFSRHKNDEKCIFKTREKRNIFLCKFYLLSKYLKSLANSDFFFTFVYLFYFLHLYFMRLHGGRLLASSKPHPVPHALSRHLCTWQAQHLQWCLTTPNQGAITHHT